MVDERLPGVVLVPADPTTDDVRGLHGVMADFCNDFCDE
jgi:hypothetical protein